MSAHVWETCRKEELDRLTGSKKCTACNESKPATAEFWRRCKGNKDGWQSWCKACMREHQREYRQKPEVKERLREYDREYHRKYNQKPEAKERKREYQREYHRKYNQKPEAKERKREYQREYRQKPEHKERRRERRRERQRVRTKTDTAFAATRRIRCTVKRLFSSGNKPRTSKIVGNVKAFVAKVGPRPGKGYELHHIAPLHLFQMDDLEHARAAHIPENLAWVTAEQHKAIHATWTKADYKAAYRAIWKLYERRAKC